MILTETRTIAHTLYQDPPPHKSGWPNTALRKRYAHTEKWQRLIIEPGLFVCPSRWPDDLLDVLPYERYEDNPSPFTLLSYIRGKGIPLEGKEICDQAYLMGWLLGFPDWGWDDVKAMKEGRRQAILRLRVDLRMRFWFLGINFFQVRLPTHDKTAMLDSARRGVFRFPHISSLKRMLPLMIRVEKEGRRNFDVTPRPIGEACAWHSLSDKLRWLSEGGAYQRTIGTLRGLIDNATSDTTEPSDRVSPATRYLAGVTKTRQDPEHTGFPGSVSGSPSVPTGGDNQSLFGEDDPSAPGLYRTDSYWWTVYKLAGGRVWLISSDDKSTGSGDQP